MVRIRNLKPPPIGRCAICKAPIAAWEQRCKPRRWDLQVVVGEDASMRGWPSLSSFKCGYLGKVMKRGSRCTYVHDLWRVTQMLRVQQLWMTSIKEAPNRLNSERWLSGLGATMHSRPFFVDCWLKLHHVWRRWIASNSISWWLMPVVSLAIHTFPC